MSQSMTKPVQRRIDAVQDRAEALLPSGLPSVELAHQRIAEQVNAAVFFSVRLPAWWALCAALGRPRPSSNTPA